MTTLIALVSTFLAGSWWDNERRASTLALIFATVMLAIGGLS